MYINNRECDERATVSPADLSIGGASTEAGDQAIHEEAIVNLIGHPFLPLVHPQVTHARRGLQAGKDTVFFC